MTRLDQLTRLEWQQPKAGSGEYHLVANEQTLGVLHISPWGKTKTTFTGNLGAWEITSEGFWNPKYYLRESARQLDIASYTQKWHGTEGTIQISSGPQFTWSVTGWFQRKYSVKDSAGREVVAARLGLASRKSRWRDWARIQGTMELDPGQYDEKVNMACTVMAWFLVLRNQGTDGSSSAMNAAIIG